MNMIEQHPSHNTQVASQTQSLTMQHTHENQHTSAHAQVLNPHPEHKELTPGDASPPAISIVPENNALCNSHVHETTFTRPFSEEERVRSAQHCAHLSPRIHKHSPRTEHISNFDDSQGSLNKLHSAKNETTFLSDSPTTADNLALHDRANNQLPLYPEPPNTSSDILGEPTCVFFESEPKPDDALPPTFPEPQRIGALIARQCIEVLVGLRPLRYLQPWMAPGVYHSFAKHVSIVNSARTHHAKRQRVVTPRIVNTRVFQPKARIAEVSVVIFDGRRIRAIAVRLEVRRNRWLVTALEIA